MRKIFLLSIIYLLLNILNYSNAIENNYENIKLGISIKDKNSSEKIEKKQKKRIHKRKIRKQRRKLIRESLPCILKQPFEIIRNIKELQKLTKVPNAKNPIIQLFLIIFWIIIIIPLWLIIIMLYTMAVILLITYIAIIATIAWSIFFGIAMFTGLVMTPLILGLSIILSVPIAILIYLLLISLC